MAWEAKVEGQFSHRNSEAVVDDPDQASAAVFDLDRDVGRAGIDGVFDQFLDDGSGPFDDFAGGDAIDQRGR